jgi:uncharacterized protein
MSEEEYTGNPTHQIPGMISWTELFSQNPEESKAFYSELFGWEIEDMEMPGMTYTMFKCGNVPVAGLADPAMLGESSSTWMNYITVEKLEDAIEKTNSLGGSLVIEPTPLPQGRFAIIRDTHGAAVGLYEYAG